MGILSEVKGQSTALFLKDKTKLSRRNSAGSVEIYEIFQSGGHFDLGPKNKGLIRPQITISFPVQVSTGESWALLKVSLSKNNSEMT